MRKFNFKQYFIAMVALLCSVSVAAKKMRLMDCATMLLRRMSLQWK